MFSFCVDAMYCTSLCRVAEMSMRESHEHDAILMSNGEIFYYPSVKLNLPCLNRTAGELECNFGIGSWALSSDHLDIHLVHKNFDTTKYVMDPHYSVAGILYIVNSFVTFDLFKLKVFFRRLVGKNHSSCAGF